VEQVENRVLGTEDTVEESDQVVNEQEKILIKREWNVPQIWDTIKGPNLQSMGVEGEKIQTKGIDSQFNKIISENILNLDREASRCRTISQHQTVRAKKETLPDRSLQKTKQNKTQHIEQRKNTESCKREKTSHIYSQTY
jgi:hypothetical protein